MIDRWLIVSFPNDQSWKFLQMPSPSLDRAHATKATSRNSTSAKHGYLQDQCYLTILPKTHHYQTHFCFDVMTETWCHDPELRADGWSKHKGLSHDSVHKDNNGAHAAFFCLAPSNLDWNILKPVTPVNVEVVVTYCNKEFNVWFQLNSNDDCKRSCAISLFLFIRRCSLYLFCNVFYTEWRRKFIYTVLLSDKSHKEVFKKSLK